VIDETIGADAMVAYASAVPNIDALNRADARFVVTPASPSETLARTVLANFDLSRMGDDPWVRADGAEDVYTRFRKADRDKPMAFVLWEPYLSKALEQSGAHLLLDSSRFRGYIVDVLVAQRQFLLEHEDVVRLVVEAYLRTAYEVNRGGEMEKLLADDARASGERLTQEQVARLAKGIWFKNTTENYAHMAITDDRASQQLQRLDLMIGNISAVLQRTGGIAGDPTGGKPNMLYYDGIFRKLYSSDFHPAIIRPATGEGESVRLRGELPALTDQQWRQLVSVGTLRVDRIVFARGTATLTHQSELALDRLAEILQSWPQYYLRVQGHARHEGDVEANRRLATERAAAARQYIVSRGIAPHRVNAVSTEPADTGGQAQSVSFVLGQTAY
jgi:flagellar motor protein MotB